MTPEQIHQLTHTVQYNCHIVDARYGGNYTLCIYLIKMREFFRWESGRAFGEALPQQEVGEWLSRRESLWDELQDADFRRIEIDGEDFDPFDADAINRRLIPRGLAYSGGLAQAARPHFFLAHVEDGGCDESSPVCVVGHELARDLAAPPAMAIGGKVFLRRESLRRMLWEKLENWRWSRADNPMGRALACYDFEQDLHGALDRMTETEIASVTNHERGEVLAGEALGEDWNHMLLDLAHTPAELIARAVRDHWADCASTLPALIRHNQPASIHFFVGNLGGMRKELFPGLLEAYRGWLEQPQGEDLTRITERGAAHWRQLAFALLDCWRESPERAAERIRALGDNGRL